MRLSCSEEEDIEEDIVDTGAMERALLLWTELLERVSRICDDEVYEYEVLLYNFQTCDVALDCEAEEP